MYTTGLTGTLLGHNLDINAQGTREDVSLSPAV